MISDEDGRALVHGYLTDMTREKELERQLASERAQAAALATRRGNERKALSERERQVLRLLAEGGSYAEIGSSLFLSPDTVRSHAQRAMQKLGARTRTQAVAVALREVVIG